MNRVINAYFLGYIFTRMEKLQRSDVKLSERLASLGIMGEVIEGPLKSPVHHNTIVLRDLKGPSNGYKMMRKLLKPMKKQFTVFCDFYFFEKWSILYSKFIQLAKKYILLQMMRNVLKSDSETVTSDPITS